jgi:hypothetical protein
VILYRPVSLKGLRLVRILDLLLTLVALAACTRPTATGAAASSSASTSLPSPWEARLGQVVTIEGTAEDAKLGAVLTRPGDMVWIDGLDAWPRGLRGKRVQVTGKVIQRADLPVFVQREGEPQEQGIPVPPGTDVEKARRRFLLTEARWKVVE